MVDGYGSRIKRESEELRVDGAWHFPICDHNGIKRTQSPSRKVRGDRDFKAGSKIRSEERYPATQRQQSIVAYVDSTGAVSAEYAYDPFGKVIAHTGRDFDFLFSTKFYDPDIDMYYYGYRYYSPELRRWASPDPIGEEGGLNLYGFCGNQPIVKIDKYGDSPIDIRIQRIETYLLTGNEIAAAGEAKLLYHALITGGNLLEPLAAQLMEYWLKPHKNNKEDKRPFSLSPRHVKKAMLYDKPRFLSPKDQLAEQLCAHIGDSLRSSKPVHLLTHLTADKGTYYHALGTFDITFSGTFRCSSKRKCSFSGEWDLTDTYDWHEGKIAYVLGKRFEDSWALLVEEYHDAHSFKIKGSWCGSLSFQCGCFRENQGGNR